jgi:hypothetical protein
VPTPHSAAREVEGALQRAALGQRRVRKEAGRGRLVERRGALGRGEHARAHRDARFKVVARTDHAGDLPLDRGELHVARPHLVWVGVRVGA